MCINTENAGLMVSKTAKAAQPSAFIDCGLPLTVYVSIAVSALRAPLDRRTGCFGVTGQPIQRGERKGAVGYDEGGPARVFGQGMCGGFAAFSHEGIRAVWYALVRFVLCSDVTSLSGVGCQHRTHVFYVKSWSSYC